MKSNAYLTAVMQVLGQPVTYHGWTKEAPCDKCGTIDEMVGCFTGVGNKGFYRRCFDMSACENRVAESVLTEIQGLKQRLAELEKVVRN